MTCRPIDLFVKEPLKGNSEVHLHTPTKFGEDPSKDLGGDREHTHKHCSNYSMIPNQHIYGHLMQLLVLFSILLMDSLPQIIQTLLLSIQSTMAWLEKRGKRLVKGIRPRTQQEMMALNLKARLRRYQKENPAQRRKPKR